MIEIKNLNYYYTNKSYYQKVLHDISFNLKANEFVLIRGKSGSGKSTLAKIMAGIITDYQGEYTIDNIKQTNQSCEQVEYIHSKHQLIPQFTVLENLLNRTNEVSRIHELLELVNLKNKINTKLKNLSGGEIQRVSVIASLLTNKPIIIADEPTQGLDEINAKYIISLFSHIKDKTIIFISHNPDLVKEHATQIIELVDGTIKIEQTERKLIDQSITPISHNRIFPNPLTQIKRSPFAFILNCFSFIIALMMLLGLASGLNVYFNENPNSNPSFSQLYQNRLIIMKEDNSGFTNTDKNFLNSLNGKVIYNDIFLDGYMKSSYQDMSLDGQIYIYEEDFNEIIEGQPIRNKYEILLAIQREDLAFYRPLLNQTLLFGFDHVGIQTEGMNLTIVGLIDKETVSLQSPNFYVVSDELVDELELKSRFNNVLLEVFDRNQLLISHSQSNIQIVIDDTIADNTIEVPNYTGSSVTVKLTKGNQVFTSPLNSSIGSNLSMNQATWDALTEDLLDSQASLLYSRNMDRTIQSLKSEGFSVYVINQNNQDKLFIAALIVTSVVVFALFIGLDLRATQRLEKSLAWHGISYINRVFRKVLFYLISVVPATLLTIITTVILKRETDIVFRFLFGWINPIEILNIFVIAIMTILILTALFLIRYRKVAQS
jgi:ABC-type lipoprotein export system ATPase subunit